MIAPEPHTQSIEIEEVSQSSPDSTLAEARELLLEYGRFVIAQPGAARFCFGTLEKEAARLPLSYQEQGGGSLLARVNSKPAGFVAWRSLSAEVASQACGLKRLWVRPSLAGLDWEGRSRRACSIALPMLATRPSISTPRPLPWPQLTTCIWRWALPPALPTMTIRSKRSST